MWQIDVSGGDKIPRKGGPGITQSDLLIVNKTDLAEIVGADLNVMERDAAKMRYYPKGPQGKVEGMLMIGRVDPLCLRRLRMGLEWRI